MNIEDVKIGMKVVPHSKLNHELYSNVWNDCIYRNQPYMYVIRLDRKDLHTIVMCGVNNSQGGDFFLASDLTPYEKQYTCNIPGVTVELVPGKEYWVSDFGEREAVWDPVIKGKYICTIKDRYYLEMDETSVCSWKYAVDPDAYREPETEMTVEEIAEALRKSGAIKGKLKIKE